jgi:signal-transduction protein with cAMP-binding, CBS, and nucleotidyltransferase domain
MGKGVISVYSESSVGKAVAAMADHNIGCVVVMDTLGPCGIFTERDLLSKVVARGLDPVDITLTEVLSPSFPAVDAGEALEGIAKEMLAKHTRLMVLDGPDIVGMVTPTDVVRALAGSEEEFQLSSVLSKDVAVVPFETPIDVAIRVMDSRRIGSVLVESNSHGMSIFTERDLVKRVVSPRLSMNTQVGTVSTSPLITADMDVPGRKAAGIMLAGGIKRLPLVAGTEVRAVVTARDVVEAYSIWRSRARLPHVDWVQWN